LTVFVSALPNVQPPFTLLQLITVEVITTPLVVIVLPVVEDRKFKTTEPALVQVKLVAGSVNEPYTFNVDTEATLKFNVITASNAPPAPPVEKLRQLAVPGIVTVKIVVPTLELASKITSSAEVGAEAPPAPPLVVDQFVVVVVSHVPDPKTQ
jgi:hypothetical protein